jgi:NhaP-type Na+/H+ or K+/H+ antiporter
MKFNFRKVASILASGVMLASTMGIASAATTFPAPFSSGSAIVYGANAAATDNAAAATIFSRLGGVVSTSKIGRAHV